MLAPGLVWGVGDNMQICLDSMRRCPCYDPPGPPPGQPSQKQSSPLAPAARRRSGCFSRGCLRGVGPQLCHYKLKGHGGRPQAGGV